MKTITKAVLALGAFAMTPSAHAATFAIDFDEAVGVGAEGSAGNTILTRYVGANARVTGVSYNVSITTPLYWLIDQSVLLGSTYSTALRIQPGYESFYAGTETYVGSLDLVEYALDFLLDDDGILKLEFVDTFNTEPMANGAWGRGNITVSYDAASPMPEPASWAMLFIGMAAVGGALRYQRRSTTVAEFWK